MTRPCSALLCAVLSSVWPAFAGIQTPTNALPAPLRAHIKEDRFQVVTSLRGLPLGVREALPTLFGGGHLDIAEPGAAYRGTGVSKEAAGLPTRRLVLAACSTDHCLIYYERGGPSLTWRVTLFHWTPAATTFEWGGAAPGGVSTIYALRNAVLSGSIGASSSW